MSIKFPTATIGGVKKFLKVGGDFVTTGGSPAPVPSGPLCFTANTAGSTISMSLTGTPTLNQNFQYSTDKVTWSTFTPKSTTITLANIGDKVYFKGNNPNGVGETYEVIYTFTMTGSIAASGNIMSLIDNGACTTTTIPNVYCFNMLFNKCTALTTPPELPATTLTTRCYCALFEGCTNLTTAPVLPATTVLDSSYQNMFYGCTSLTTAPALPATELIGSCYHTMFYGCTSLTTPPALPATTLGGYSYYGMFQGCSSLIVSDTSGTGYDKAWRIPTDSYFTQSTTQYDMFTNCAGTRSQNYMVANKGWSKTYYTQNTPVLAN